MVAYQKFGVIAVSVMFAIIQKLKLQQFRIFLLYQDNSSSSSNSSHVPNSTDAFFEDENVEQFLFKAMLVSNCVSLLPCILLAAWSDRYGRKPLLFLPYIGSFISDIINLIIVFVPSTTSDILLISEGIYGIFGGNVLMITGCLCYITDATDHRQRTFLIGLYLGIYNSVSIAGILLQYFWTPLYTGLTFQILVMIGVLIKMSLTVIFISYINRCVSESVFILGSFHGNPWTNLLTPINVSDTVNCVFKRRLDNMRIFIIALTAIYTFYSIASSGNSWAFPQHFRNVFLWSHKNFMIFDIVFSSCQAVALWMSVFLASKWKSLDSNLGACGSLSLGLSCIVLTFSKQCFLAVIGTFLEVASLLLPVSVISMLSKLTERTETGSMYAGIAFLTLVSQLIAVPLYQALAKACQEADIPEVVFLLSFGLATFIMLFFIYLRKNISPDLLGHLNGSESLALINKKGQIEQLFE